MADLTPGQADLQRAAQQGFNPDALGQYKAEHSQHLLGMGYSPQQVLEYWGDAKPGLPPGAHDLQKASDEGFTAPALAQYKAQTTQRLLRDGDTPQEIQAYWGDTPPDDSKLRAYVQGNVGALSPDDRAKVASNPAEIFRAGLQHGATSLLEGPPNLKAPPDMGFGGKLMYGAGQMLNEVPEMGAGFMLGSVAGAPLGAAAGGAVTAPFGGEGAIPGAAVGAAVGGGAGANALPTAMRDILMDFYSHQNGPTPSWDQVWQRASAITLDTFKAGAVGGVSNLAGVGAGRLVGAVGGGTVTRGAANIAAQTAAATTTGAALEGQVPTLNDFVTGAVLAISLSGTGYVAGRFHGALNRFIPSNDTVSVAENLRDIYVKTGMQPKDISEHMRDDPALLDEVLAPRSATGAIVTPGLHALAPPEPAPFKPEPQVQAPEVRRPQIAFGDSLAVGTQRHAGMFGTEAPFEGGEDKPGTARIGASTSEVLRRIDDSNPDDVRGIDVLLSTGASNSPSRLDVIPAQIQALKDKGARSITIMGVGTNPKLTGINENLQKIADAAGGNVHFIGPLKHVGPDGIHSTDYRAEITGTVGSHMQPQAAPSPTGGEVAPGEQATTGRPSGSAAPEAPAPKTTAVAITTPPEKAGMMVAPTPEAVTPAHLQLFRTLEGNLDGHADHAVSPAGAVGRNQILPTTASEYGFDPSRLQDPDYNDQVARAIISDLSRKFEGNLSDMLVAYNAGPGRARAWIAGGRRMSDLPVETQHYLEHAERLGALSEGYNWSAADRTLTRQGDTSIWVPPDGRAVVHPAISYEIAEQGAGGGKPPGPPGEPGLPGEAIPPERPEGEKPFALNEDMLADQILDIVGDRDERSDPHWLNPRRLINSFNAQLTPARRFDQRMGIEPDEISAEDMLRSTYGSAGRAEHFVRWGVLDAMTLAPPDRVVAARPGEQLRLTGPRGEPASIINAFRAVKEDGGTSRGFVAYLLAKRATEKAGQGIDTGVNLKTADNYLAVKGVDDKYERAAGMWREVTDGTVDYVHDSGVFSDEQAAAMKALNPSYVTHRRIMDPEYAPPRPPGRTFGVRTPTRKMAGSNRQIDDPITATVDNIHTMVAMADRNRAVGHILAMATNNRPGEPAMFTRMKVWEPPVKRPSDWDVRDAEGNPLHTEWFDSAGNPLAVDATPAVNMLDTYRQYGGRALGPNEFVYFNRGKMEIWHTKDTDLAEIMRAPWTGQDHWTVKILTKVAALQRAGITSQFSFPFRSVLHGQMASTVLSPTSNWLPYHDVMDGLMGTIHQGEDYRRWIASGGADASLSSIDGDYIQRDIGRIFAETGTYAAVWNSVRHPFEALRSIQHSVDAAARLGSFLRSEREGASSLKAAMQSRTAYLDHAEPLALSWLQTFSRMVPFMTIGWKDWQQFTKAITQRPGATITKAGMLLTLPTVINYAVNYMVDQHLDPKDRYDQIPQWERDLFWVLPPIDGIRMRIPRPYVVGFAFATMPEHFMNWLRETDVDAIGKLWDGFVRQALPPVMPALPYPIAEGAADMNFYSGRPLIKQSLEKASGYMSYEPDTTETAKAIARFIGAGNTRAPLANPIVTDEYLRQWAGPAPMWILQHLEMPWHQGGPPVDPSQNIPFVSAFLARQPGTSAQSIQDFYSEAEKFDAAHANFVLAIRHGNPMEAHQSDQLRAGFRLEAVKQALTGQNQAIQAINQSNETDAEKRKAIDGLTAAMISTAQDGLQQMKEINAALP